MEPLQPFECVLWHGKEFYVHDVDGKDVTIAEYPPTITVPITDVKKVHYADPDIIRAFVSEVLEPRNIEYRGVEGNLLTLHSEKRLTDKRAATVMHEIEEALEFYRAGFPVQELVISLGWPKHG